MPPSSTCKLLLLVLPSGKAVECGGITGCSHLPNYSTPSTGNSPPTLVYMMIPQLLPYDGITTSNLTERVLTILGGCPLTMITSKGIIFIPF